MKTCKSLLLGAATACATLLVPSLGHAQTLLGTIEPGIGSLVGVAFDPQVGSLFVYPDFSDAILEYLPDGTQVPPDIGNAGADSNDYDLDFALAPVNIGGTVVGENTLLVVNAELPTITLFGLDKDAGTLLSSVDLPVPSSVGGAHHAARGTFFNLSWLDDTIYEINMTNGSVVNSFPLQPGGSPLFDVFFGDLDVNQETGNLYVVGSAQNTLRELSPTGEFIQDIPLGALGINGMSGLAYVDGGNEAFISSTNGTIYYISLPGSSGGSAAPEPGTLALVAGGILLASIARRRRTRS